jgi:RHS repeat-associated protein
MKWCCRNVNKENTKFIYDGQDVLIDDNAGVLTKYQNGLGIDNKLKVTSGGVSKYFLQDHLGSTIGLTNSSGAITEQTAYDSFGNATNNLSTRYQFTGREYDSFTGLHYYRARFYDAQLGRFISEDPIKFKGGMNWYGYVDNNPTNYSDPYGLNPYKLPANPGTNGSSLPNDWKNIPEHRDPNNPGLERWVSPDGSEGLEFHPGKSGEFGWEGKDHWHKLKPKPGRNDRWEKDDTGGDDGHFNPGEELELDSCFADNGWKLPDWVYPPSQAPSQQTNPSAAAGVAGTIVVAGGIILFIIFA